MAAPPRVQNTKTTEPPVPLKEVSYRDSEGRNWKVLLPENVSEAEASRGIPVGPPSLAPLKLPLDVEVRLHNELYARQLFIQEDYQNRRQHVMGALMAALRLDVQRLVDLTLPTKEG